MPYRLVDSLAWVFCSHFFAVHGQEGLGMLAKLVLCQWLVSWWDWSSHAR